jgi:hypothetical protein
MATLKRISPCYAWLWLVGLIAVLPACADNTEGGSTAAAPEAAAPATPVQQPPGPRYQDDQVMVRVRVQTEARPAWLPKLARRLRPVALGAAATWAAAVVGGGLWLGTRADIPAAALVARGLGHMSDLIWVAVLRVGALLHLSGLSDLWAEAVDAVPGPGVLSALAVMTALSGLAIWTLHRVVGYEPPRIDAHV